MLDDLSRRAAGWLFVVGAVMLWLGWMLLPVRLGTFFEAGDFAAVRASWHQFVWMYRVHIFGLVISLMAIAAFAASTAAHESRALLWPGFAVAALGFAVGALAQAFYYHHGAWGALDLDGKPAAAVAAHVNALLMDTEYVTCLERFSRVFFGLGQVVLGVGFLKWKLVPGPLGLGAILLGMAAMFLTMVFGDNLEFFQPVFHLDTLWLLALGWVLLRQGR